MVCFPGVLGTTTKEDSADNPFVSVAPAVMKVNDVGLLVGYFLNVIVKLSPSSCVPKESGSDEKAKKGISDTLTLTKLEKLSVFVVKGTSEKA